jgi:hypothetical protein
MACVVIGCHALRRNTDCDGMQDSTAAPVQHIDLSIVCIGAYIRARQIVRSRNTEKYVSTPLVNG